MVDFISVVKNDLVHNETSKRVKLRMLIVDEIFFIAWKMLRFFKRSLVRQISLDRVLGLESDRNPNAIVPL